MQHFRLLVLPACAALALSACTGEDPEPTAAPSTAAPTVTESPTPSPEPESTPSEEPSPEPEPSPTEFQSFPPAPEGETEEQRAIREGWEEHQRVMDEYLKDPTKRNLLPLQATVTGKADEETVAGIMDLYASGVKRVGDVVFRDVAVGDIYVDDEGRKASEISYCQDFTQQSFVEVESGQPVDDEPVETMTGIAVMVFDARERWVLADWKSEQVEPC